MESSEIIQTSPGAAANKPQKNLITTVVNGGIHRDDDDDDEQRVEIPIRYTSLKELLPANYCHRRNSGELECQILQIKHPLIKQAAMAYLSLSFKSMPPPSPEEDSHWWKNVFSFRRRRQRSFFVGRIMDEDSSEEEKSNKEDYSKVGCMDFFHQFVLGALGFGYGRMLDTKHD